MATIANLSFPEEVTSIDTTPLPITSRFPVPPTAWGFMTDGETELIVEGLTAPYYLMGAVAAEGSYLEPTRGQIWPRIG